MDSWSRRQLLRTGLAASAAWMAGAHGQAQGPSLAELGRKKGLWFGSALSGRGLRDPRYLELIAAQCALIVPENELKMTSIQREPGVFLCETVLEYQHCRTLMGEGKIFGCRAGLAFDGGFAEPIAAEADDYELDVRSNAEMVVTHGQRGEAKVRGTARVEVTFGLPPLEAGDRCLQRDRYVYYPTGPKGGLGEIDDIDECDAPIQATVVPNEDDALQAYDMCDVFAAWGGEIEQPIELLVAALFHVDSSATFSDAGSRIVAPYVTVRAPMKVSCQG